MKFKFSREWLTRRLAIADDTAVGAGGTSMEAFRKDVESRTVTPTALANAPTQLGKVVKFIRERRGLSQQDLATLARLDEAEVQAIEGDAAYTPSPRAVVYLADALELSKPRLQELVGFVKQSGAEAGGMGQGRFAANSKGVRSISEEEYEAVRALVEVLSEKRLERP